MGLHTFSFQLLIKGTFVSGTPSKGNLSSVGHFSGSKEIVRPSEEAWGIYNQVSKFAQEDFLSVYPMAGTVGSEKPDVNMTGPFLQGTHSFM